MSVFEIVVAIVIFVTLLNVVLAFAWSHTVGRKFAEAESKLLWRIVESEASMNAWRRRW